MNKVWVVFHDEYKGWMVGWNFNYKVKESDFHYVEIYIDFSNFQIKFQMNLSCLFGEFKYI